MKMMKINMSHIRGVVWRQTGVKTAALYHYTINKSLVYSLYFHCRVYMLIVNID